MGMQWVAGALTLALVALILRWALHMDTHRKPSGGLGSLRPDLQEIYQPIAQEVETHTSILGITLNEAFGERRANRHEMAWHIVRLATGEWKRLSELVVGLQNLLAKFLPVTDGIVPVRRVATGHFKSHAIIDHVRLYEFLDQVLFSSKHRFALQLRVLLRASEILGQEFKHACREGERTLDSSEELWTRLDYYFHDFDLIAKETLLAFRTLLACQSPEGVQELALDLNMLLERGIRVSVSPASQ